MYPDDNYIWIDEPLIGLAIGLQEMDSDGNKINPFGLYWVGRHKVFDLVKIVATGENIKNKLINETMAKNGRLN